MIEHPRLGSIPPQTMRDMWKKQTRERAHGQIRPDISPKSLDSDTRHHIFKKPGGEKIYTPLNVPEFEVITCVAEVQEGYDAQGGLGVILQFSGIVFTDAPVFEKSRRNYGPDSRVFHSPVEYKNGRAFLILATYGDILETQVVATKVGVRPFFREEILLPLLTVTHDPTSMTVYEKNHIVVVDYKRL